MKFTDLHQSRTSIGQYQANRQPWPPHPRPISQYWVLTRRPTCGIRGHWIWNPLNSVQGLVTHMVDIAMETLSDSRTRTLEWITTSSSDIRIFHPTLYQMGRTKKWNQVLPQEDTPVTGESLNDISHSHSSRPKYDHFIDTNKMVWNILPDSTTYSSKNYQLPSRTKMDISSHSFSQQISLDSSQLFPPKTRNPRRHLHLLHHQTFNCATKLHTFITISFTVQSDCIFILLSFSRLEKQNFKRYTVYCILYTYTLYMQPPWPTVQPRICQLPNQQDYHLLSPSDIRTFHPGFPTVSSTVG